MMKRIIALLLAVVMVVSICPVTTYAAATEPNVTLKVNKTEVNVGDTVTVTLDVTAMKASSVAFGFDFDTTMLSVARINTRNCFLNYEAYDPDFDEYYEVPVSPTELSTVAEANEDGHIGIVFASGREYEYLDTNKMVVITFTALKAGTVEFEMFEDSAGTDGYKDKWTHETTVTIIDPNAEPSCEHKNQTTTTVDATCTTAGSKTVTCDDCGKTISTEDLPAGHNYGDLIPAKDAVHTQTELKGAVAAHYYCAACKTYFTEGKVETTLGALTDEIPAHSDSNESTDKDHNCDVCGLDMNEGHTEGEPVVTTTPASCTEEGTKVTETFCTECETRLSHTETTIPAGTGCELGDPAYTWADDYSSCTAEIKCQKGTVHKTETVTTSSVTTPGTCQTAEVVTYYADFSAAWTDPSIDVTGEKNPTNHVGTATISYRDNQNGTHTAVSTYECGHSVDGATANCSDGNDADELCDSCGNNLHVCAHDHYEYVNTDGHVSVCSCDKVLGNPEEHELGENDLCVCGAWLYTNDYNGGASSEDPGKDSYEYYWGPDSEYNFAWNVDACKEVYSKAGYVFAGFAYDAEGENPLVNPTKLTSTTKVYVVWACNHDEDVYKYTYTDNGNGTHTVKCACGETINPAEEHTYDETTHECACGDVAHVCAHDHYDVTATHHQSVCSCNKPIGEPELHDGGTASCNALAVCDKCEERHGSLDPTNHAEKGSYDVVEDNTHQIYYSCCGVYGEEESCTDENEDGDHQCDFCVNNGITDCVSDAEHACEIGKCVECGEEVEASVDHENELECGRNCTICGEEIWSDRDHTPLYGCDKQCQYCSEEIWPDAECVSDAEYPCLAGKCIHCEGEMGPTEQHEWIPADCTNAEYCDICGETGDPALGHGTIEGWKYTQNEADHTVTCLDCEEYSYTEPHDYTTGTPAHTCICEAVERYTITFMNGDEFFAEFEASYGVTADFHGMPIPEVPTGYSWDGWYTADGTQVIPGICWNADVICYATFKINSYTVTWTVNGEKYAETTVCYGKAVTAPTYTAPEGHTFSGWDVPATMPAENLTLDATLTVNYYTLTISTYEKHEIEVPYGAKIMDVIKENASELGFDADGKLIEWTNNQDSGEFGCYGFDVKILTDDNGVDIVAETLMPAKDFHVNVVPYFTGWNVYDTDGDGAYTDADRVEYHDNGTPISEEGWYHLPVYEFDVVDGVTVGRFSCFAWYYFEEVTVNESETLYFRVEGLTRVPYPTEAIDGKTYGPDAEAKAYYESKGKKFKDATEAWFLFDVDGKLNTFTGVKDGHYYSNGMQTWHPGVVEDMYFIGDEVKGGNKPANGDTYITKNSDNIEGFTIGHIYNFKAGKLSGAHGIVDGKYYENSRLMAGNGLTKVGDKFIYVNSNGVLVVNTQYWVPANTLGFDEGMYTFDENGFMVIPEADPVKDGIYFENGAWYYYENSKIAYNKGLISTYKIWYDADGKSIWGEGGTIYVRSNGQLATGTYYITNVSNYDGYRDFASGDKVTFDELGKALTVKNGIVEENGTLYYYVNGTIAYNAGVIEIDGNYYYVKSTGEVVNNRNYWITNVGDSGVVAKQYTFDAEGVMQDPVFKGEELNGIHNGYYYENGKIAYARGIVYLEDEDCYIYVRSNGQLATGIYWPTTTNGYDFSGRYDFGNDGKLYI